VKSPGEPVVWECECDWSAGEEDERDRGAGGVEPVCAADLVVERLRRSVAQVQVAGGEDAFSGGASASVSKSSAQSCQARQGPAALAPGAEQRVPGHNFHHRCAAHASGRGYLAGLDQIHKLKYSTTVTDRLQPGHTVAAGSPARLLRGRSRVDAPRGRTGQGLAQSTRTRLRCSGIRRAWCPASHQGPDRSPGLTSSPAKRRSDYPDSGAPLPGARVGREKHDPRNPEVKSHDKA
jgi:hypothetical protein